jgi:hypothetical protein
MFKQRIFKKNVTGYRADSLQNRLTFDTFQGEFLNQFIAQTAMSVVVFNHEIIAKK